MKVWRALWSYPRSHWALWICSGLISGEISHLYNYWPAYNFSMGPNKQAATEREREMTQVCNAHCIYSFAVTRMGCVACSLSGSATSLNGSGLGYVTDIAISWSCFRSRSRNICYTVHTHLWKQAARVTTSIKPVCLRLTLKLTKYTMLYNK